MYLEVRCPVVKPQLIVISDSGKTTVDFSEVSIGQSTYRSVTIQNISDKMVKVSALQVTMNMTKFIFTLTFTIKYIKCACIV